MEKQQVKGHKGQNARSDGSGGVDRVLKATDALQRRLPKKEDLIIFLQSNILK
jgi:hypothetical protein